MDNNSRIEKFIDDLNSQISHNYEIVKDIFNSEYGYPALDPVRDEICKCFICGLYQSTITLTNHFLEKSLKFCLGIKYSIENKKDDMEIKDAYIDGINKYDDLQLEQSINAACSQGLITKNQKQELKGFKDQFRNPYSHANKAVFSGKSVKGKQVSTKDLENGLESFLKLCFDSSLDNEIPIENLPFAQGIIQVEIAKEDCYPYFESVDKLVRSILQKIKNNDNVS
ncbi:MAG: hypothetical protein LWW85_01690 [Marinilabiliales bacterium]|nr:hypothetical protein [Marinilabiliales bacterium]